MAIVFVALPLACENDFAINEPYSFGTRIVDAQGNPGFFNDLAVNPNTGQPAISYFDQVSGGVRYAELNAATSQWEIQDVISPIDLKSPIQLEFTQTGQPHIAFYDSAVDKMKYARWDGLSWMMSEVSMETDIFPNFSMILDANNIAHFAVVDDSTKAVRLVVFDPDTEATGEILVHDNFKQDPGSSVWVSLEIREVGEDFLPVILSVASPLSTVLMNQMLREGNILSFGDSKTIDKVPGGGSISQLSTILADKFTEDNEILEEDVLHISYYDSGQDSLIYSTYSWSNDETYISLVDVENQVGGFSSLAIGTRGQPVITFYDDLNNDLIVTFISPKE